MIGLWEPSLLYSTRYLGGIRRTEPHGLVAKLCMDSIKLATWFNDLSRGVVICGLPHQRVIDLERLEKETFGRGGPLDDRMPTGDTLVQMQKLSNLV